MDEIINIRVELQISDLAENICNNFDRDQIEKLIIELDEYVADVDFTSELMDKLYGSLLDDNIMWTNKGCIKLDNSED